MVILVISIYATCGDKPIHTYQTKMGIRRFLEKEKKIETSRLGIFIGGDVKIYMIEWGYPLK